MKIRQYKELTHYSSFRKIALGTWKNAGDPSTYCQVEFEVDHALEFLEKFNQENNSQVKINHLLCQAISLALTVCPEINTLIRGNRIYYRESVDSFHQVVLGQGVKVDLSGAVVRETEKLALIKRVQSFKQEINKSRNGQSEAVKMQTGLIPLVPLFMMRWFLNLSSFLVYRLNIKLPGISEDPFGSYMFSDTATLGIPTGFIPLIPYSRTGLLFSPGLPEKKAKVCDDQVVVKTVLPLSVTFDHRLVEGFQMARMYQVLKTSLADPAKYLIEAPEQVAAFF